MKTCIFLKVFPSSDKWLESKQQGIYRLGLHHTQKLLYVNSVITTPWWWNPPQICVVTIFNFSMYLRYSRMAVTYLRILAETVHHHLLQAAEAYICNTEEETSMDWYIKKGFYANRLLMNSSKLQSNRFIPELEQSKLSKTSAILGTLALTQMKNSSGE